ncbi:MAG: NADH:flavin oxidoreductase [Desulfobacterales bacterium]|nr:MAG: NADH:flavin oxidoreductase [Desulfobacterales bacterium]
MASLFDTTCINALTLPNRFIRSATWTGLADANGACSQRLIDLMVEMTRGKLGLIVTGHAYVSSDGQATPRQLGIDRDSLVEDLSRLTGAVQREGGRIFIQLAHGGLRSDPKLTGQQPAGPCPGQDIPDGVGRQMTVEDIHGVIEAFAAAALRANKAGFDGVQIHAAHGYLLSQFLSPAFNRRTDEYGGSIENRARIVLQVYHGIRRAVGNNYPVFIKLNTEDFLQDGLTVEDSLQIGVMLDRAGVDAVELSGGSAQFSGKTSPFRKDITFERDQAYFRKAARAFKKRIKAPVILVGGIRSYLLAERLVDEGYTDYIALSRPLIREPRLVARWQSGDLRKAACISCNGCLGAARSERGIFCVLDKPDD